MADGFHARFPCPHDLGGLVRMALEPEELAVMNSDLRCRNGSGKRDHFGLPPQIVEPPEDEYGQDDAHLPDRVADISRFRRFLHGFALPRMRYLGKGIRLYLWIVSTW